MFLREWKAKVEVTDNVDEDKSTYLTKDTFIFRPDKSNGLTGEEILILPNFMLTGMAVVVKNDRAPMLPLISKAIIEIFKPTSFLSELRAMDVLFRGIPIDCSSENFAAQAVCTALEGSSNNIKTINESHFQFSFMGGVNINKINILVIKKINNNFESRKTLHRYIN